VNWAVLDKFLKRSSLLF